MSSPFWLYVGIIRNMILPIFGEKSKAALTEIRGPGIWAGRYYYNEPDFYYTFILEINCIGVTRVFNLMIHYFI